MNLGDCLSHLIYEFKNEHDLVKAIEEISKKFTTERNSIGDYLNDPRLVSAYTAFYLTTNYPKFEAVLPWLSDDFKEAIKNSTLIDLGAGPGTFSLAFAEWAQNSTSELYQVETSKLMREQGKKLWDAFFQTKKLVQLDQVREIPNSFVLFGHSANEMKAKKVLDYLQKINPDHILFIEPGTKDFFQEMLIIREELLKKNFHQLYPCPHDQECPLKNHLNDWCHQYIHVQHSPDVERLTQLVRKDRRVLPLTVAAFSKTIKNKSQIRVVRTFPENKFSYEWQVCGAEKLDHYQVFKRGLSKKEQKILSEVSAGDAVTTQEIKQLEDKKRVEVLEINNLSLKT